MVTALVISATTLAGCGGGASASPNAAPSGSTSPTSTWRPLCPAEDRGSCLGLLSAGTYTTQLFQPQITFTVPAGWSNLEDQPGEFLLLPPGFRLSGVGAGGDYVGIYASVAAANVSCADSEQPGVEHTAAALAAELAQRPGLTTMTPTPVSMGLQGLALDIRMADGWTKTCFYSQGKPVVPLIRGTEPFIGMDNPIGPGVAVRLYLLDGSGTTLAVEVEDNSGGTHLEAYSAIADQLHFGK